MTILSIGTESITDSATDQTIKPSSRPLWIIVSTLIMEGFHRQCSSYLRGSKGMKRGFAIRMGFQFWMMLGGIQVGCGKMWEKGHL